MDDLHSKLSSLERRVLALEQLCSELLQMVSKIVKYRPELSKQGIICGLEEITTPFRNFNPSVVKVGPWIQNVDTQSPNGDVRKLDTSVPSKETMPSSYVDRNNSVSESYPSFEPYASHKRTPISQQLDASCSDRIVHGRSIQRSPRTTWKDNVVKSGNLQSGSTYLGLLEGTFNNAYAEASIKAPVISTLNSVPLRQGASSNNSSPDSGIITYQELWDPDGEPPRLLRTQSNSSNLSDENIILTKPHASCSIPNTSLTPPSSDIFCSLARDKAGNATICSTDSVTKHSWENKRADDISTMFGQGERYTEKTQLFGLSPQNVYPDFCVPEQINSTKDLLRFSEANNTYRNHNGITKCHSLNPSDTRLSSSEKQKDFIFKTVSDQRCYRGYEMALPGSLYKQNANPQYWPLSIKSSRISSRRQGYILPRKINGRQINALEIIALWENGYFKIPPLKYWGPPDKTKQQSKVSRWKKIYFIYKNYCSGRRDVFIERFSNDKKLMSVSAIINKYDQIMHERESKGQCKIDC